MMRKRRKRMMNSGKKTKRGEGGGSVEGIRGSGGEDEGNKLARPLAGFLLPPSLPGFPFLSSSLFL